jgi:serine/threonine-protein kinase ULK/ATG1
VKLFDVARTPNYLYIFLEYCNDGDLKKYLMSKPAKRLSEVEAVIILKHIVEGFRKLFQLKIIHRDIKPANILLHNGTAKITDFGFARIIESEMNDPSYFSRVGSPLYMAPQILEGQPFSSKCDIWSLGVMLFEMLYGKTPWEGDSQYNLLQAIKKQPLKFPPTPAKSDKIKDLITHMLQLTEKV